MMKPQVISGVYPSKVRSMRRSIETLARRKIERGCSVPPKLRSMRRRGHVIQNRIVGFELPRV
jgi:hypothetical protein